MMFGKGTVRGGSSGIAVLVVALGLAGIWGAPLFAPSPHQAFADTVNEAVVQPVAAPDAVPETPAEPAAESVPEPVSGPTSETSSEFSPESALESAPEEVPEASPKPELAPPFEPPPKTSAEKTPKTREKKTSVKNQYVQTGNPAPVTVWGRTVVVLRAASDEDTSADRAAKIAERIKALPPRADLKVTWGRASLGDVSGVIIGTQQGILLALLPEDLDPGSGQTLEDLSRVTVANLQEVLAERAEQMHWPVIMRGLGLSAAATLVYVVFLLLLLRIRKATSERLDRVMSASKQRFSIAGVNLLPILLRIEQVVIRLLVWMLVLVVTYVWISFCFRQFFYTQSWAQQSAAFFLNTLRNFSLGIVRAMPGIVTVILIVWLTRAIAAGISGFFASVERGSVTVPWLHPDSARASRRIVLAGIWLFALTVAYPYIPGSDSAAFKGISVFAGVIISLGSSGFVSHVMGGLMIAYSRALRPGDYVKVGEIEGTVEDLGFMSTKVVTLKREWITIPNGVMVSSSVTNFTRLSREDGLWISTTVTIGYDAPWRQVHALLLNAVGKISGARKWPHPTVLQRSLSDFYVEYELRFAIDRPEERVFILSELHTLIQDNFNEAGVQIMSPHFLSQPDKAVVVPKEQWHTPPAKPPEGEGK